MGANAHGLPSLGAASTGEPTHVNAAHPRCAIDHNFMMKSTRQGGTASAALSGYQSFEIVKLTKRPIGEKLVES